MPTVAMSKPKLVASPALRAAALHRLDGLNEAQRAGRAALRAAEAERRAIRDAIRQRAHATRRELVRRFPACFRPHGSPKLPLMIGTYEAVRDAAPDIATPDLINTITDYCNGQSYLRALIADADRIGLDGKPAGAVTPSHAEHAAKMLNTAKP